MRGREKENWSIACFLVLVVLYSVFVEVSPDWWLMLRPLAPRKQCNRSESIRVY